MSDGKGPVEENQPQPIDGRTVHVASFLTCHLPPTEEIQAAHHYKAQDSPLLEFIGIIKGA